ncbi:zonadhesin-like isoform X2 [Heptranchias perlo]
MLLGQLGSCAPVVTFCNGKEVGIYADPKDVASFYQCLGNVTVYSTCQNNLIFDSGLAWCVSPPTALPPQSIAATPPAPAETLQAPAAASQAPAAATQAPAATTQAPAATTQAPAATTQAPAATTQAPAATTQAPAATTQAPAAASHTPVDLSGSLFFCSGRPNGFYEDPQDVASYYFCWLEETSHITCTQNLVFSTRIVACVHPMPVTPPTIIVPTATTRETPVLTSESLITTRENPITTMATPITTMATPITTRETPITTRETPITTRENPTTRETPITTRETPITTRETPITTRETPVMTSESLTTTRTTPTATTVTPTTVKETPTMTKKTITSTMKDPSKTVQITTVSPGPSDVDPDFCLRKETGHFQDPLDRSGFYQCVFGQTFHLSCPDQLVFNPGAGMCDWPENVPIQGTFNSTFCKEKVDGNYANPINPSTFYQCSAGMAHHVACQTSLVYDEIANACVWPYSTPTTALPQITGTTNGSTTRKPNICCGKDDGLYPNPKDESSFLQCASEITFYMSCPTELVFNPLVNVCDRPTNDSK